MRDEGTDELGPGYWPSVTDLFLSLFVVAIAILVSTSVVLIPQANSSDPESEMARLSDENRKLKDRGKELDSELEQVKLDLAKRNAENQSLKQSVAELNAETARQKLQLAEAQKLVSAALNENDKLKQKNERLAKDIAALNDKPPIIQIRETAENQGVYRFASGSSEISTAFREGMFAREFRELAESVLKRHDSAVTRVNTLEIIGHTDTVQLSGARGIGNLDALSVADLHRGELGAISSLRPGSNNDLGLLRALAVRIEWRQFVDQKYAQGSPERQTLDSLRIRCYSAGQTLPPIGPPMNDVEEENKRARRIEIRLTRMDY